VCVLASWESLLLDLCSRVYGAWQNASAEKEGVQEPGAGIIFAGLENGERGK
jgi:hypothetical protein